MRRLITSHLSRRDVRSRPGGRADTRGEWLVDKGPAAVKVELKTSLRDAIGRVMGEKVEICKACRGRLDSLWMVSKKKNGVERTMAVQ